ncbi:MAG: hypothetical protein ABI615_05045 [Chthoniobacterales bacterium]
MKLLPLSLNLFCMMTTLAFAEPSAQELLKGAPLLDAPKGYGQPQAKSEMVISNIRKEDFAVPQLVPKNPAALSPTLAAPSLKLH